MLDYLDWLLSETYTRSQRTERCVHWLTVGLVLGALLIYFF